jgi:hypothetical protein
MSTKPARVDRNRYVPSRSDTPGEAPTLLPGEIGTNEATGAAYVMRQSGTPSTLPTANGFDRIETLSESDYASLVAATATIATVLYIVTPEAT